MPAVAKRLPSCASTAAKPSPTCLQVPKPRGQAIDLGQTYQQVSLAIILHTCRCLIHSGPGSIWRKLQEAPSAELAALPSRAAACCTASSSCGINLKPKSQMTHLFLHACRCPTPSGPEAF